MRERNRQEQTQQVAAPALVLDSLADQIAVFKAEIKRLEQATQEPWSRVSDPLPL